MGNGDGTRPSMDRHRALHAMALPFGITLVKRVQQYDMIIYYEYVGERAIGCIVACIDTGDTVGAPVGIGHAHRTQAPCKRISTATLVRMCTTPDHAV